MDEIERLTEDQMEKLPKWAQKYIERLEYRHKRDNEFVRKAAEGDPDSNTQVDGIVMYPDRMLENNASINFFLGESRERHADTVNVGVARGQQDELRIMSNSRKRMVITPQSGNVFRLKLVDW